MKIIGAICLCVVALICTRAIAGEALSAEEAEEYSLSKSMDVIGMPLDDASDATVEEWKGKAYPLRDSAKALCDQNQDRGSGLCKQLPGLEDSIRYVEERPKRLKAKRDFEEETKRSEAAMQKKIADENRRFNGPEGAKSSACGANSNIAFAQSKIDEQKEIAKTTGVFDKKTMYEMGQLLVIAKKTRRESLAKYKKLTGKDLDFSTCKPDQGDSE